MIRSFKKQEKKTQKIQRDLKDCQQEKTERDRDIDDKVLELEKTKETNKKLDGFLENCFEDMTLTSVSV